MYDADLVFAHVIVMKIPQSRWLQYNIFHFWHGCEILTEVRDGVKVRSHDPILSDPIVLDPIIGSYEHT